MDGESRIKVVYEKTDNFYNQKVYVTNIREPRFEFFGEKSKDHRVMHVGCADTMAFSPESNLHIFLSKIEGVTLHGLDLATEDLAKLQEHCPGMYYTRYVDVKEEYDLVLVPEVMEHVPNVHSFLQGVFSIKSNEYLITVPSILQSQIFCNDDWTLEMVHPDHKYWFSPYTLWNTVSPFFNDHEIQMYYLENKSQIGISLKKKQEEQ